MNQLDKLLESDFLRNINFYDENMNLPKKLVKFYFPAK